MEMKNIEGAKLSPKELEGKHTVASGRIGGKTDSDTANRQKPIYKRNSQSAGRQALEEAAEALSALWKIRRPNKNCYVLNH